MRLKVQTTSPLFPLKAWLCTDVTTIIIFDLKIKVSQLCSDLSVTAHGYSATSTKMTYTPANLALFLDEFELLDSSKVDSILRDGDLICVRLKEEVSNLSPIGLTTDSHTRLDKHANHNVRKRKWGTAEGASVSNHKFKRTTIESSEQPSESSSESSISSSSSSSSDNDSSQEDSDGSSSSSSSSSSSDFHFAMKSSSRGQNLAQPKTFIVAEDHQHKMTATKTRVTSPVPYSQPHVQVPPGHGKASTHSRNLRRRRKLQAAKLDGLSTAPKPPAGSSAANITPLGAAKYGVIHTAEYVSERESIRPILSTNEGSSFVPMASLRSKNKKRAQAELKTNPLPRKIVFEDNDIPVISQTVQSQNTVTQSISSSPVVVPSSSASSEKFVSRPVQAHLPIFIPPSERTTLPFNIFVTSIDVEPASDRRKHRKLAEWLETAHSNFQVDEPAELPYDDAEDQAQLPPTSKEQSDASAPDVQALIQDAENRWDTLVSVSRDMLFSITPNSMLSCKALAINPITYTPEFLLSIYRVVAITPSSISLQSMLPTEDVSFGNRKQTQSEEDGSMVDSSENPVEDLSVEDILDGWKLLT